jgi:hypothetical protein
MRKLFIFFLIVLVGVSLSVTDLKADTARTITHKFRAFTSDTEGLQAGVIYGITGVATGANAVFGIYNSTTLAGASTSNLAVEGGEATSGDALPVYDFGEEGLILDSGITVIVDNCTVVIEYI